MLLVFLIETEEHPHKNGTVTMMSAPMLSYAPTTVTSEIIVLDGSTSPSIATDNWIPSAGADSPSGIAMFAWNATS